MAAFCGKCGCVLLKSYFFAQSVEIKSRKLELLVVLVVERRLVQALAQALVPISNIQRAKGNEEAFIQRQKEVQLQEAKNSRFRSLHHRWVNEKQKNCHARGTTSRKVDELRNCERHTRSCKEETHSIQ